MLGVVVEEGTKAPKLVLHMAAMVYENFEQTKNLTRGRSWQELDTKVKLMTDESGMLVPKVLFGTITPLTMVELQKVYEACEYINELRRERLPLAQA